MRLPRSSPFRRHRRVALAAAAVLLQAAAAHAGQITLSAEALEVSGVAAHGVRFALAPADGGSGAATFYAARVDGTPGLGRLEDLRLDCARLDARDGALRCAGRLSGRFGRAGRQDTPILVESKAADRGRLRVDRLELAGGEARAELQLRGRAWTVEAAFSGIRLAAARELAGGRLPVAADTTLDGTVSGELNASGAGAALRLASGRFDLGGLSVASADGALASEALSVGGRLRLAASRDGHWEFELGLRSAAGQLYVEPWFLDLGTHPVEAEAAGRLAADLRSAELARFTVVQAGIGRSAGRGSLDLGEGLRIGALALELADVDLATAVPVYLQPPLVSTAFRELAASGRLRGEIELAAGLPSRVVLDLEDVALSSATGGIAVEGLEGHVSWHDDATRDALAPTTDSAVFKSLLGWRAMTLWGLEVGAAELPFTTTGRHFRLLEPAFIPVFDGGVAFDNVRIRHAGTPRMYVRFGAEVRPISVARLGRALGWPEFSGSLSGRIPRLELADGSVTLGGNLEASVFDGRVTVRDLRLRDPLGPFPRLQASVDVDRLDLRYLTDTFEFGLITGRLSGRIEDLELFDWTPLRFDARFRSTPGDRSPRRISQRAVANLSSIGGGSGGSVAAALQSGFLRFFETFRYRELGLSCRLQNDVCTMDGVAPAPGGYYILRGSGIPRIDVIGSQRRVAWTRLVRQLAAMTQGGELVIE